MTIIDLLDQPTIARRSPVRRVLTVRRVHGEEEALSSESSWVSSGSSLIRLLPSRRLTGTFAVPGHSETPTVR
jgi:hypothetical protein